MLPARKYKVEQVVSSYGEGETAFPTSLVVFFTEYSP